MTSNVRPYTNKRERASQHECSCRGELQIDARRTAYLLEQAVEIDVDRVARVGVVQRVLAVTITESVA